MRYLLDSSWQRLGLQVALLVGIGLAFAVGTHEQPVLAEGNPDCPTESECTFKKPNVMLIMDYSTSMNNVWDLQNNLTRWQVVVESIKTVTQDGSFLAQNTHLALMRFGHDPAVEAGTTIFNDSSGIVDGQVLDVPWYDAQNNPWLECNGAAIGNALDAAGEPINGSLVGIGTWTKGAMDYAKLLIDQSIADHPDDNGERAYVNVVVTDGAWTSMDGTTPLAPANQDPAITATDLFDNQNVRTYVVAVAGDPAAELAADQLASAGGTGPTAIDGDTPALLELALATLVQEIIDAVVAPDCVGGLPRIMILLDASSSMLNFNGGTMAGGPGETGWDQARDALAGADSLFDVEVDTVAVEDLVHLGLAVFGHNVPAPGEQEILVDYGPCMRDNIAWALDPETSCELPGCDDPWGGPPITWTFADGQLGDPMFLLPTTSHMPQCAGNNQFCSGSGTYTHLGLQLIKDNQAIYLANAQLPNAPYPANDQTEFINILITDGQYTAYSTNAQVQAELEQMFAAGTTTYVIGFGDGVDTLSAITQLQSMADWGSGGALDYYDANNQASLALALAEIVGGLSFSPCCGFIDCTACPEPSVDSGCLDGLDDDGGEPESSDSAGTTESTTDESTTTDESATEDSTSEASTGDSSGESESESGGESGSEGTSSGGVGEDEIGSLGAEDDSTPVPDDRGDCSCATAPNERGLAGSLVLLGLAGLVRRRRSP